MTRLEQRDWLDHRYFRTYQIADYAEGIVTEPFAHLRDLEAFVVEDGVVPLTRPWSKWTALHAFIAFVTDALFQSDCTGPNLILLDGPMPSVRRLLLPVDFALELYELDHDPFVPDAVSSGVSREDASFDYFCELRLSGIYEQLLAGIADEVFYLMFQNRAALAGLHGFVAMHVSGMDPEDFDEALDDCAKAFAAPGRLARKAPPAWARRAVFFREHGRCAHCRTDLSRLIDALPARDFDHIIPLAAGGLNDVTNLQLLCTSCNRSKGKKTVAPATHYRRWYRS